eukprot:CFRG2581T1
MFNEKMPAGTFMPMLDEGNIKLLNNQQSPNCMENDNNVHLNGCRQQKNMFAEDLYGVRSQDCTDSSNEYVSMMNEKLSEKLSLRATRSGDFSTGGGKVRPPRRNSCQNTSQMSDFMIEHLHETKTGRHRSPSFGNIGGGQHRKSYVNIYQRMKGQTHLPSSFPSSFNNTGTFGTEQLSSEMGNFHPNIKLPISNLNGLDELQEEVEMAASLNHAGSTDLTNTSNKFNVTFSGIEKATTSEAEQGSFISPFDGSVIAGLRSVSGPQAWRKESPRFVSRCPSASYNGVANNSSSRYHLKQKSTSSMSLPLPTITQGMKAFSEEQRHEPTNYNTHKSGHKRRHTIDLSGSNYLSSLMDNRHMSESRCAISTTTKEHVPTKKPNEAGKDRNSNDINAAAALVTATHHFPSTQSRQCTQTSYKASLEDSAREMPFQTKPSGVRQALSDYSDRDQPNISDHVDGSTCWMGWHSLQLQNSGPIQLSEPSNSSLSRTRGADIDVNPTQPEELFGNNNITLSTMGDTLKQTQVNDTLQQQQQHRESLKANLGLINPNWILSSTSPSDISLQFSNMVQLDPAINCSNSVAESKHGVINMQPSVSLRQVNALTSVHNQDMPAVGHFAALQGSVVGSEATKSEWQNIKHALPIDQLLDQLVTTGHASW